MLGLRLTESQAAPPSCNQAFYSLQSWHAPREQGRAAAGRSFLALSWGDISG